MKGTWYTLAVVDEEGDITGAKGAVLAPSRPVEVVQNWKQTEIGQAVPASKMPTVPQELMLLRLFDGETIKNFVRLPLAHRPTHKIRASKALWVWERIE